MIGSQSMRYLSFRLDGQKIHGTSGCLEIGFQGKIYCHWKQLLVRKKEWRSEGCWMMAVKPRYSVE